MKAVCPGSFDPVTHGHVDIIARAARMFDEVVVGVGRNTSKTTMFDADERVAMLRESLTGIDNVRVATLSGLLVDFCHDEGIAAVVKGLRFAADFDYELQMAQMNARIGDVETVLLPTSARWGFVSSTLVREIATLGGDVGEFVPEPVARRIAARRRGADGR